MRVLSGTVKIFFVAGSLSLLVALAGFSAGTSAAGGGAASLAAAETAFAQESVAKGAHTAFLDALSDDAIAFEPGPQNGKRAWQAVLAAVSTGPWS